jgi:hypothetical protein
VGCFALFPFAGDAWDAASDEYEDDGAHLEGIGEPFLVVEEFVSDSDAVWVDLGAL